MGINVEFLVSHEDNETITEEEMDQFLDEFIELVEKHNWICGGGVTLQDAIGFASLKNAISRL